MLNIYKYHCSHRYVTEPLRNINLYFLCFQKKNVGACPAGLGSVYCREARVLSQAQYSLNICCSCFLHQALLCTQVRILWPQALFSRWLFLVFLKSSINQILICTQVRTLWPFFIFFISFLKVFLTRLFPVLKFVHFDLCTVWPFLIVWYLFLKAFWSRLFSVLRFVHYDLCTLWPFLNILYLFLKVF